MQNHLGSQQLGLNQGQSQQSQSQSQGLQLPPANYTLPGIINYLTSEFTNLERFKIMTNIEKSEMKYMINQLQGEVNALKYINDRQTGKILLLERENELLKQKLDPKKSSSSGGGGEEIEQTTNSFSAVLLPEIDLLVVKNSREKLTRAMKEVAYLLRTPSPNGYHYLNLPDPTSAENGIEDRDSQYDELFNEHQNGGPSQHPEKAKYTTSGFAKYLEDKTSNLSLTNSKSSSNSRSESSPSNDDDGDLFGEIVRMEDKSSKGGKVRSIEEDEEQDILSSDAETVIYDQEEDFSFNKEGVRTSPPIQNGNMRGSINKNESEAPGVILSTARAGYTQVKVFPGLQDSGILIYVNYNNNKSSDSRFSGWISVYDTTKNLLISSCAWPKNLSQVDDILDIYCLSNIDDAVELVIVCKNGAIESLKLDGNKINFSSRATLQQGSEVIVNHSSLIEFERNNREKKNFGLAFTTHEDGSDSTLKVFQICLESTPTISDIGSLPVSKFGNDVKTFEVISWNNATGKKNPKKKQPNDIFEPILQVNNKLVRVNPEIKTIETITTWETATAPQSHKLLAYDNLILRENEGSNSVQLYDLQSKQIIDETSKIKLQNLIIIKDSHGKHRVISIDLDKSGSTGNIMIFNDNLGSEFKLKVDGLKNGKLGRCGGKVILLDDNNINLIEIPDESL